MAIEGQNPLTDIGTAKEQKITFQPLALFQIDLVDGTSVYYSGENLDATMGGFQYKGNDYRPRIMSETLGALQSVTDTGLIQLPQISLKLADADKALWNENEVLGIGYNGGRITVRFVFWDPDTNVFSTDEQIKFVGICNPPSADWESLTLTAVNILNLANFNLPTARISRTCIKDFPATHQDRIDAATNPDSIFKPCRYSVDVTDTDVINGTAAARGNNDPSTGLPFTSCDFSWDSCIARMGNIGAPITTNNSTFVQIEADTMGRKTGVFGGIHYDPPEDWRGREYTSGTVNQQINNPNDAKFSDYFPNQYGVGFVSPPVMNTNGNPNSTKFEVVLSFGSEVQTDFSQPGAVIMVIVNDFVIPFRNISYDPSILGWAWVNGGSDFGSVNRDLGYDGRGDPYGSMVALAIVVPVRVQDSNGLPNVRVLWAGNSVKVFNSNNKDDFYNFNSTSPVWCLYDILTNYCSLTFDDIDLDSVIAASTVCNGQVTYTDLTGNPNTHSRYECGIILRERRSAQDIVNNMLAGFKALLTPNSGITATSSGKLQLFIKQTLADQQSADDPHPQGSNDITRYQSAHADGSVADGYLAYHFHKKDILRKGPDRDSPPSFKIEQRAIPDTPSNVGITFQDKDYQYTDDSITITDSNKVNRCKQEVSGGLAAEGIVTFDQARRVIQTQFAEQFRGNPRSGNIVINGEPQDDTGGTWIATFDTSFKAIHLRVGHIIGITYPEYGLDAQQFRILAVTPQADFETINIRCQWHEDDWYLDSYGQVPDPILQAQRKHRLNRPPFGWLPDTQAPLSTDPMIDPSEKTFAIREEYEAAADGTSINNIIVRGKEPVNDFSAKTSPPYAPILLSSPTGGHVKDGTYYAQLVAVDAAGNSTGPSNPVTITTLTGSSGNGTLTIPNIYWQSGTEGYKVYAGLNPNRLSLQSTGTGTPSHIDITDFVAAGQGLPDVEFDHMEVRVKRVIHSGIIGAAIAAVRATEIDIAAIPGVDLTNRIASITGRLNASFEDMPIWDFLVTGNSGFTLTIGGGVTDLTALTPAPKPGDVLVIRTAPDIVTSNTIGDSLFVNGVNYFNPPLVLLDASNTTPIIIQTNVAHGLEDGDNVFVKGVTGNAAANGEFDSVTIIDATHIQLTGSTGSGDYGGGGVVQLITHGMEPHAEKGNDLFIAYGTGRYQWRKIVDNDRTTVTVDTPWGVTPDNTSVFYIMEPNTIATVDTTSLLNADPNVETSLTIPIDNYLERTLWAQAFCESADGKEAVLQDSPGRDFYVFGGTGNVVTQYDKTTFNIAVTTDLIVADDVDLPAIVRRAGTPVDCQAKIKMPSVGQDVHIDIILTKHDGSYSGTIFGDGTYIVLPANATDIVVNSDFMSGIRFDEQDILTVNVTQTGTTQAGKGVAIVLKYLLD